MPICTSIINDPAQMGKKAKPLSFMILLLVSTSLKGIFLNLRQTSKMMSKLIKPTKFPNSGDQKYA